MEGGGEEKNTKARLRQGMEIFLADIKDACRRRGWRWKLVCCGSRGQAYRRFRNERKSVDAGIVVLLVDSESEIDGATPIDHLAAEDGWNFDGVDDEWVHLMVQTMEAWIVADPGALGTFYGRGFQKTALPQSPNLEKVSKMDIERALDRATQGSQKGKYHKIRHAKEILQSISPAIVRQRCPYCERLFGTLLSLIDHNV